MFVLLSEQLAEHIARAGYEATTAINNRKRKEKKKKRKGDFRIQLIVISSPGTISLVATADIVRSRLVNLLNALEQIRSQSQPIYKREIGFSLWVARMIESLWHQNRALATLNALTVSLKIPGGPGRRVIQTAISGYTPLASRPSTVMPKALVRIKSSTR